MNKKSIIILTVLVLAIFTSFLTVMNTPYNRHISAGYNFNKNGDYTAAMREFRSALNLDSKDDRAYAALIETYSYMETDTMEQDIADFLEQSIKTTDSDKLVNTIIKIADNFFATGKPHLALRLLDKCYLATYNNKLNDTKEKLLKNYNPDFAKQLFVLFEQNKIDEVKQFISSKEFKELVPYIKECSYPAELPKRVEITKNGYIYYGEYNGSVKEGSGIWLCDDLTQSYEFKGLWKNDKPNGIGTSTYTSKSNGIINTTVITSQLVDGFINGIVTQIDTIGNQTHRYEYTAVNGTINNLPSSFEITGTDNYYIAECIDKDGKKITAEMGKKYGVAGY